MRFTYCPPTGRTPHRVALLGEVSDWLNALPMLPVPDGSFVAEVDLGPGVYAYKLLIDGAWTLDPENPRTRSTDKNRNSVASVGGMDEPFLFAPTSPFVEQEERGGLRLMAAVRRGADTVPIVRWAEHDGEHAESEVPMRAASEEDEHTIFEARLPSSAARVRYSIGSGGPTFVHERVRQATPAWWKDALVYTVYVDRFRPERDRPGWERNPGRNVLAGGHLEGIRRSLDELADLGVTVVYLTPIHVGQSSHRYDFVDPLAVDPALGGEAAFERLVDDLHARGMRVLVDLSFSHAGMDFPPCADVLAHGRSSRFADWFLWTEEEGAPALRHYGRRKDAPLIDLTHPAVQNLVLETVSTWAKRGIDGLRLDMAAEVPLPLARQIRRRFLELQPDGIVLGELVPAHAWRWVRAGAIDAATDFGFHGIVTDLVARGAISPEIAARKLVASDLSRGGAAHTRMRFLSTHDHVRFFSVAHAAGRMAWAPLGMVLLATLPGVPALVYGEEVGIRSARATSDPEDVWEDRAPMPWAPAARDGELRAMVKALFGVRRASKALSRGELEILHRDEKLMVYRRAADGDVVDVLLNFGAADAALEISDVDRPRIEVLATLGTAGVERETVRLGPRSALVVRRGRDREDLPRRVHLNVLARDRDMALGRTEARSLPTRIDFAVTEICNLRCEHCITFAPSRTSGGSARTLSPWVLDRLRPALAHASYFGFVHGGESLAAPIFWDVLAAIREERGREPYTVHLLTNGVLLRPSTVERLMGENVRSLSVSLDGATAATNDAIRVGGRFDAIIENLREAARLRDQKNADLRLGISYVLMRSNLHEVPALIDLCASLGVDWIKLEEAVPVNAFATRSLVAPSKSDVLERIAQARKLANERGIVLVDHTIERTIWRCKLDVDVEVAEFVRADEFANRSEIHPCRAPWEVACVEPNGDIRGGHFFGPILGNVAHSEIQDVWNGPRAREERMRAYASRICGPTGPVTCVPAGT